MSEQQNSLQYNFDLKVGQKIVITDPVTQKDFSALVVGADHYDELTAAANPANPAQGLKNNWVSYTLTSEDAPPHWGKRFWAVDSQKASESGAPRLPDFSRAFYVAAQSQMRPEGFQFEDSMSGRVKLTVDGEALHAKEDANGGVIAEGTLFTFRDPKGKIWAEEVFTGPNGEPERMVFDALKDVKFKAAEPNEP